MAKIFLFDIETAPFRAFAWRMWKENIGFNQIIEDWYMLSWAGKFLDNDTVFWDNNMQYGDPFSDTGTVSSLHAYIDEADIVVAHNGNRFDIKKMNTRFMAAGLEPPSPYRKVDTLAEAKKNFAFTSNRLDALGKLLGCGEKIDTGGFGLWNRCLAGEAQAFQELTDYNIQDVVLLEEVYLKLRPWMQNHPNLGVYNDEEEAQCPKCGSTNIHFRGHATTQAGRFTRFQCQDCGGWGRTRYTALNKYKRKSLVTNVQN